MAIVKENKVILSSAASPAGASTKASPGRTGTAVDCTTYYGGELTYKISNGSSAPTTPCTITFQVSPDGASWFDYYSISGDVLTSSVFSGALQLDRGVMWVRAVCYGNQTNSVTVEAALQAVTGV